MADAGYWRDRINASGAQNPAEFAEVLAVDRLPPIHAGSKASAEYAREFRAMLHAPQDDAAAPPDNNAAALWQFAGELADLPDGERIIRCFSSQPGEVIIGLPLSPEAS